MSYLERRKDGVPSQKTELRHELLLPSGKPDYIALMKARAKRKDPAARRKMAVARAARLRRARRNRGVRGWIRRWFRRIFTAVAVFGLVLILLVASLRWVNPPLNVTMAQEMWRLGRIERSWVPLREISPHAVRAAIAAEDANFCVHWGFDIAAIRLALQGGARRGGSTISQQTAKNVFLWQQRSWVRKGLEAGATLMIEGLWGKSRIIETYLNVAEFDEGVFGVEAAATHYFGVPAKSLNLQQSARLMAILPSPKTRSASKPSSFVRRRASSIASGAETIRADGRSACVSTTST